MNTRKFLVSGLMLVSVLFSACAPAGTPIAATTVPATATIPPLAATSALVATIAPTDTPVPMPAPLTPVILAEWKIGRPEDVVFGFDSVWVPSRRDPNITTRIDPLTNEIIAVIEGTGYKAKDALVAGDGVWVTGQFNDTGKIDPATNKVVARVSGSHSSLAFGFGSIWSTSASDELDRIDPATAVRMITPIPLGDGEASCENGVMVATSAVWVIHCDEGELIKIDPATNSIVLRVPQDQILAQAKAQTTIPAGKGSDFLWMILGKGLVRIDANTGAGLGFLPHVSEASVPTVTDDSVWVVNDNNNHPMIMRLNVATNQIAVTYKVGPGVYKIGLGFGSVWLVYEVYDVGGAVQRLDIVP